MSSTDEPDVADTDPLDALLAQVVAAPDGAWTAALEAACSDAPEHADALRQRVGYLQRCGMIAAAPGEPGPMLPQPGARFGPFDLGEVLGHGAMGIVFRARRSGEEGADGARALKVMRPELLADPNARRRFLHEGQVTVRLRHRHLCRVHEVGEVDGVPFLAMALLDGETLADRLDRARRQGRALAHGWPGVVHLFEKVARGLGAAHAQGLVHRDIKPANLMIDADGEPVLFDFGLAIAPGTSRLTRAGAAVGTPAYMPPEQVRGDQATGPAADVYSLGASLYEALVLRPPYGLMDREALYRRILHGEPDDPRRLAPQLPRSLGWVLRRCLEKNPRRRYPDAAALAEDLARVRLGQRTGARAASPLRLLVGAARRRPVGMALAVAAVLALGLALQLLRAARRDTELRTLQLTGEAAQQSRFAPGPALDAALRAFELEHSHGTRSQLLEATTGMYQAEEVRTAQVPTWAEPSPDGRILACAGRVAADVDVAATPWAALVSSPGSFGAWSADGRSLAIGGPLRRWSIEGDGVPKEVDLAPCEPPLELLTSNPTQPMPLLGFDHELLLCGDVHGRVVAFGEDGACQAEWLVHDGAVQWLFVLDDGRVLTFGVDGVVRTTDLDNGTGVVLQQLEQPALAVAALSGDRRWLVVCDGERLRRVTTNGSGDVEDILRIPGGVRSVAVDHTGRRVVAGGRDQQLYLITDGPVRILPRDDSVAGWIDFYTDPGDSDRDRFAVGYFQGPIRVFDGDGGRLFELRGHRHAARWVRFVQDGDALVSAGYDQTVRVWQLERAALPVLRAPDKVMEAAWLPGRREVLAAGGGGALWLFDVAGRRVATARMPGVADSGLQRIRFAPPLHPLGPGLVFAVSGEGRGDSLQLWTCDPGAEVLQHLKGIRMAFDEDPEFYLNALGVGFDRQHRLVAMDPLALRVYAPDGQQLCYRGEELPGIGKVMDVSADGRSVVRAFQRLQFFALHDEDGRLREAAIGPQQRLDAWATSVALAPGSDGRAAVVGLADGQLLWVEASGEPRLLGRHESAVNRVVFSPDGAWIASAGSDDLARVWTRDGEPWLDVPHGGIVHAVRFDDDGRRVLTAGSNRQVRIWPILDDELVSAARAMR